jgi:phosphoglycolate phosphatase
MVRNNMRYPLVFFDLDGTLTNPTEGITRSVQYALAKLGVEAELEALLPFIGPPLNQSFQAHYGFEGAALDSAIAFYREYFVDKGMYQNRLFDGIPELLNRLCDQGATLCVVTSKPTVYSDMIVRHFRLDGYSEAVTGSNLDLSNADKTTLVRTAMDRFEPTDATKFVMIGDREHDIIGANANGIASIDVTYGAGSREELTAANATYVFDTTAELEALLLQ